MKTFIKTFPFLILFLITSFNSSAQEIQWGIHFNASVGWIPYMGNDRKILFENYQEEAQFSFSYGGSIQIEINKSLAFESGLMILNINDSGIEEYDITYIDLDGTEVYGGNYKETDQVKSSYIGIPLLFVLNQKRLNVKLGPHINYLLYDRIEAHRIFNNLYSGYSENIIYKYDLRTRKIDYGITANLGYTVFKNCKVNLQYYHGIQNIFNPGDTYSYSITRKNRLLALGISYYLNDGKE